MACLWRIVGVRLENTLHSYVIIGVEYRVNRLKTEIGHANFIVFQKTQGLPKIWLSSVCGQRPFQSSSSCSILAMSSNLISSPSTPIISSSIFLIGADTVIHNAPVILEV